MQKEKATTYLSTARHWLQGCLVLLLEALIWAGGIWAASKLYGTEAGTPPASEWYVLVGWGLLLLFVATLFVPNNSFSRTARRDEVVACAMKTALAVCVLSLAVFTERTSQQACACILFFVALGAERLILNAWFIRHSIRHSEHGIIISDEETAWQQKVLQQNTYGLKLSRLEEQSANGLEAFLAEHPRTESVYVSPSALTTAELEDVAHTCRKHGLTLHILPLRPSTFPQTMQSECRGSVCVLSPARLPLQSSLARMIKRLTDIVLSLTVLLTVFPLFALIAYVCIKRQSRGPVLTSRHMCGMDGKPFQCLTFRTRHYEAAPSFFQGTGDPGYFPFGKFLSLSRMELMPQFLCVLWGKMTIVGSQMMRPEQYAEYRRDLNRHFASGCRLKAGITSCHLAPQKGGSTQADIWYCRNWGFWLDLRIMLQRLGTLIRSTKAKSVNYI